MAEHTADFYREHGRLPQSHETAPTGERIGSWLRHVRLEEIQLTADRIAWLEDHLPGWDRLRPHGFRPGPRPEWTSPELTPEQVATLGDWEGRQQEWADAARRLIADGATIAAIAHAVGRDASSISGRLSRYPSR